MTTIDLEKQLLEQVLPQLEAEGYSVYLEPSPELLPAFMKGYIPDAIALGKDKKLAIEIVVDSPLSSTKERALKHRFEKAEDWELRILYARPTNPSKNLPVMEDGAIDDSIASAENLLSAGQLKAAFLIAWATFEALGRALSPEEFVRPQTPARLIEVLAANGYVTPSEADILRELATIRNQFIHGSLNENIDRTEVQRFIDILGILRRMKDTEKS